MVSFRKRKKKSSWTWDPESANITADQAWALLTNGVYFRAAARRMDTLGGGLDGADWVGGLAAWWEVSNVLEFEELVAWMQGGGGYRAQWKRRGVDHGEEKFAWDYCRLITVSGGAALANVITVDRAWELVMTAGEVLEREFDSWQSVGENYLAGRNLWLEDHGQADDPSQENFLQVLTDLVGDAQSPWNRMEWDRSAGVMLDGQPLDS